MAGIRKPFILEPGKGQHILVVICKQGIMKTANQAYSGILTEDKPCVVLSMHTYTMCGGFAGQKCLFFIASCC